MARTGNRKTAAKSSAKKAARKSAAKTTKKKSAASKPARKPAAAKKSVKKKNTTKTAARSKKPAASSTQKKSATTRAAAKTRTRATAAAPARTAPRRHAPAPIGAATPTTPRVSADRKLLKEMKDALLKRRDELLSMVRSNRDQLAEGDKSYTDLGDRASGGFEDEITAGLLSIESAQLEEIEGALERIENKTYGICAACGNPIPQARLEILPFAKRCLTCEGNKERHIRPFGADLD
jgi:RNA polymerase-binding protein DksA